MFMPLGHDSIAAVNSDTFSPLVHAMTGIPFILGIVRGSGFPLSPGISGDAL